MKQTSKKSKPHQYRNASPRTGGNRKAPDVPVPAKQAEITARFWAAPDAALFTREEVAAVRRCSVAKLDREAWLNSGVRFVRDGARCLYRKADVIATLSVDGGTHAE